MLAGSSSPVKAARSCCRVIAVDKRGKRSGPSDCVAAPRPFLFSKPPTVAKVGTECRYQPVTIRSLGGVRMRVRGGRQTLGFWDIEEPRFALQKGPAWLKADKATGALSGTPDAPGKAEVVVSVTLKRVVPHGPLPFAQPVCAIIAGPTPTTRVRPDSWWETAAPTRQEGRGCR